MAEVGVLELKIKDNSRAAGNGLQNLAEGLKAVKTAMENFDLSPVGREIAGLAKTINEQKGTSTTIKNLSGLFNAVSKFSQLKSFKIDTQPFENLRDALKDGFKIGQAGTQLNQLREAITGDWGDGSGVQVLTDLHTAAQNLSGDAEGIKATTDAIKEAAASLKSINSYSNAAAGSDWRMGMSGVSEGKSAGADVANGMAEGVEQNKSVAVAAAVTLAQAIIEAAKSTLEIASPSKVMQQIGEYAGEGLTEGLISQQPNVEQAASSISDTIANAVSKFKTSEFNRFTAPVENLTNTFISLNKAQEAYASGIDAVLPKIQAMSSEEMIVAGNAKQAQDAIERIVERLNKPIKYKNLADMINASQGIGKQPLDAEYSAQVFAQMQDLTQAQNAYNESLEGMDKQPFSGVVKVFDQAVGAYREIEGATNTVGEKFDQLSSKAQEVSSSIEQARQSAINLADIPATGMNGTFNNAAEELTYLTEKIEEAKNSMQFWSDTYDKTQKQIKFNGPSEERTNMLQHSEEGFYAAAQSMETYQAAMNDTQAALANYIANMQTATQTVTEQVAATQAAASAVQQVNSSMDSYALTAQANANRTAIEMLFNALENPPVFRTDEYINQLYGFNSGCKSAEDSMRAFMEAMEGTSAISERLRIDNPELSGLVNEMNDAGISAREFTNKLVDVDGELKKKKPDAEQAASGFKKFKEGIASVMKPITNLFHRLKNLIIMRTLRYMIRELAKGFSEGVNNVYEYSKAVGNSFGPAMDSIKSTLETMKNSVGAAVAPVLNALIPILNNLASAAITCFNYVNQLFSLLTGQSYWVKATEGAADYTKEAKKAGGATKEWLASFDELNVMSSGGGGGGGGTTAADYKDMFENVTAFDQKIRDIADYIKDHMTSILGIAGAIATAILAWKLSTAFAETLPMLSNIAGLIGTGAVIALTLQLEWLLTNKYLDTKKDGWLFASALTTALGTTAAWAIAKKLIGGKAGAYAASITLALSAATDIIANISRTDVSPLSEESIKTNIKGALEMGAATGIILSKTTSMGLGGILMKSGGMALITFGVATGIKAMTSKEKTEWDPVTKIIEVIKSAAPVGLGLFMFGAAPAVALGVALTYGAVVALAISTPKDHIKWGNIGLTAAQIRTFVQEKMFTANPEITLKIISDSIKELDMNTSAVETKITQLMGTLHVINLGIANNNDYTTVLAEAQGVVDAVSSLVNSAENVSKLVLKFTPQLVGSTEQEQNNWYLSNISGWEAVKEFCTGIGTELADLIVQGEDGELQVKRPERVKAILNELAEISKIVSGSDAGTEAQIDFEIKLKDLNHDSFDKALEEYKAYKEKLKTAANELVQAAYSSQQRLVNALKYMLSIDPNNESLKEQLASAEQGLQDIKDRWEASVDEAFKDMLEPGRSQLQEWVEKNFDPNSVKLPWTWGEGTVGMMIDSVGLFAAVEAVFHDNPALAKVDVHDLLEVGGWDLLTKEMQQLIIEHLGGITAPGVIEKLKDELKLSASQIIKIADWAQFTTSQKLDFLDSLKKAFGASEAVEAAKQAGIDIGSLVEQGMKSSDTKIQTQAKAWNELIAKTVNENKVNIEVGADETSTQEAAKAVKAAAGPIAKDFFTNLKKELKIPAPANKPQVEAKDVIEFKDTNNAIGTEAQKTIKSSVDSTVGDVTATIDAVKIVDMDWKTFIKTAKKEFNNAIDDSFNTEVAHQHAKTAGKNIGDNIKAGMNEKNSIIEQQAQEWWDLIDGKLKVDHIIKIKEDKQNLETVKKTIRTEVESLRPIVQVDFDAPFAQLEHRVEDLVKPVVTVAFNFDGPALAKDIENKTKPVIYTALDVTEAECRALASSIKGGKGKVSYSVSVSLSIANETTFKSAIKSAVIQAIKDITITVDGKSIPINAYRNGGVISSGEIFIANENGNAEMIGRFGNQAAVANQEQMVEAMARGVQYANADQNAILRQQNELLRAILRKENVLKIGASTALGRVARQSINMYENAAGV